MNPTWVDLKGADSLPEAVHHVVYRVDPAFCPDVDLQVHLSLCSLSLSSIDFACEREELQDQSCDRRSAR